MNSEIQTLVPDAIVPPKERKTLSRHHEGLPEGEIDLEQKRCPETFDSAQACTEQGQSDRLAEGPQILAELVIEEISIDGMCGVY
jgi:mycofactocin precursor